MTEKRFNLSDEIFPQPVILEHGLCMGATIVVDKLNTLSEERNQFLFDYNMEVLKRQSLEKENEQLKQRISELELLNDGLNYALKYIKKIDVEIDVGDV